MGIFQFINNNLDHFKIRFYLIFIVGLIDGCLVFLIPVLLAEFTKHDFATSDFKRLMLIITSLYISSLLVSWVIRKYGESLGAKLGNHVRQKYFHSIKKLPVKNLLNLHSGYTLSLINKIADGLGQITDSIYWTLAESIASMSLFFYFTARESISIALLNTIIIVVFIIVSFFLSKQMVPIADKLNEKRASTLESFADFLANIFTVKKLAIFSFVAKKLSSKTKKYDDQIQKLQNFHASRWLILHGLYGVAFLSTIGFILYQISNGKVSIAVLILFVAAFAIIKSNVQRLSTFLLDAMKMEAYADSLEKIIAPAELYNEYGKGIRSWKKIKFHNVFFRYNKMEKELVIPDFHIKKGEKICIVGKSGEGKTTFLNLFANFFKPNKGTRYIDNRLYEKISQKFFQKRMTIISQKIDLFDISLKENIMLGKTIQDKRLLDLLKQFDLLEWVKDLQYGLDSIVGEKGAKISAGQKRRINLIRGVLLDREILLLDEPTANLDLETEKKVINFFDKHLSNKTAIIVSHREVIREICDRCYVIKDHVLVEQDRDL